MLFIIIEILIIGHEYIKPLLIIVRNRIFAQRNQNNNTTAITTIISSLNDDNNKRHQFSSNIIDTLINNTAISNNDKTATVTDPKVQQHNIIQDKLVSTVINENSIANNNKNFITNHETIAVTEIPRPFLRHELLIPATPVPKATQIINVSEIEKAVNKNIIVTPIDIVVSPESISMEDNKQFIKINDDTNQPIRPILSSKPKSLIINNESLTTKELNYHDEISNQTQKSSTSLLLEQKIKTEKFSHNVPRPLITTRERFDKLNNILVTESEKNLEPSVTVATIKEEVKISPSLLENINESQNIQELEIKETKNNNQKQLINDNQDSNKQVLTTVNDAVANLESVIENSSTITTTETKTNNVTNANNINESKKSTRSSRKEIKRRGIRLKPITTATNYFSPD